MARGSRETEFADAALRVVTSEGLSAVTFRAVAAEASSSLGALQKCFASKEQLLGAVVRRAQELIVLDAQADPGHPDLLTWLTNLALPMMPLTEKRRAAVLVDASYSLEAAGSADEAAVAAGREAELRGRLTGVIKAARAAGEHASTLDDEEVAHTYLAFVGGLAVQLLYDPRPDEEVTSLIRRTIRALLGLSPTA